MSNNSKMDKQSTKDSAKDEESTLADYMIEQCKKEGIKVVKKELPKGWTKVIFKK